MHAKSTTEVISKLSFLTADGCIEEITIVALASDQTTELNTFLVWSEAPIGGMVEVQ